MWSRFIEDRAGGVAPIFALAIFPIVGLVGAAVDYSRGNAARTAMLASLDATALMLSRDAAGMDAGPGQGQGHILLQRAVQPARGRRPSGHRQPAEPAAGQLRARRDRERQRADDVHPAARAGEARHRLLGAGEVGREEARARAGARQHRLDGEQRQADAAEDGVAQSAHHLADRREAAGRRQGRDHPVRHQGEHRHRLRRAELDGLFGEQHPAEPVAGLRAGPRPAERHDGYDADLRHPHQVSGRAVLRPDHDDDADRHPRHDRLHQSQFQDRRHARGRATPT